MRVVYDGPSEAVEVPDLGAVVERDVPTEVPDELGARLIEQACWSRLMTAEEQAAAEAAEAERLAAEKAAAQAAEAAEAERLAAEKAAETPRARATARKKESD